MDLGSTEFANLIAYISLVVSGTLAVFLYFETEVEPNMQLKMNTRTNCLLGMAQSLRFRDLRSASEQGDEDTKRSLLVRLSSQIEQGRFYFPNIKPNEHGQDKPPAYRGYRNVALDFLVASYNLHHKTVTHQTQFQASQLQRLFTSVVFEIVRPADRLVTIRRLTDKYFVKDLFVEDLEADVQEGAVRHMWDFPNFR